MPRDLLNPKSCKITLLHTPDADVGPNELVAIAVQEAVPQRTLPSTITAEPVAVVRTLLAVKPLAIPTIRVPRTLAGRGCTLLGVGADRELDFVWTDAAPQAARANALIATSIALNPKLARVK
jgi:hypothetical protein